MHFTVQQIIKTKMEIMDLIRILKSIGLGILILASTQVTAQEAEGVDLLDLTLEDLLNIEVTTASRRPQKISDAPATVISYSAEQIEHFGWRDLKDMFRAVVGIDVSYDVQGEIKTQVSLRGIEGNQKILVLQNGKRQNPITGERFVFGHNIPLHFYKRIELVYGPASALYGADAYAGVINLITKDGADVDGVAGEIGYVSTSAVVSHLSFGKQMGRDIDVLLSGRVYYGQDFKLHEHYTDDVDYGAVNEYTGELGALAKIYPIRNWNMLGKIRYQKFTLGFDWQHQLESNAPSSIPSNYAYVRNNIWGQDIRHIYLDYNAFESDRFKVEVSLTAGDYEINPASNFYISIDSDNNGSLDNGAPGYKYGYSGYIQGSVKLDYTISSKLNLIAGTSYGYVVSFPKTQNLDNPYRLDAGFQDDLSIFVDENGYTFGLLGLTDAIFGKRNYTNFGSFVQAVYKPLEPLTVTLGGRFDFNSIYKETFNPRIGLVYNVTKRLTLKAMAGTAYIAPSNYYRWENWANPYAMHIPNLSIKPEKLQSAEISGIYFATSQLSIRTSIFRNTMRDIIRPAEAPEQENSYPYFNPMRQTIGETTASGRVEINDNLGEMFSQGVEVNLNYRVGNILSSVGYSLTNGQDRETNSNLAKVSQHKINANVSYSNRKLFASLSVRYYSSIWTNPLNSYYGGAMNIPGATILYANAGYSISKNAKVHIGIDNILNSKHWGSAPYAESIWIQPRAPQSLLKLYGGVSFSF
jgi:iron complex outermembrane receptor protein